MEPWEICERISKDKKHKTCCTKYIVGAIVLNLAESNYPDVTC